MATPRLQKQTGLPPRIRQNQSKVQCDCPSALPKARPPLHKFLGLSRSAPPCLLQVWAEFQLLLQQEGGDPALASLVELVASCPAGGWGSSLPPPGLVQQLAGAP